METINKRISTLIREQKSTEEVEKLTEDAICKAAHQLKKQKMDVSQGFSSDCLINAPMILFTVLSKVFKSWLYHGRVTPSVLVCAFLPLLKSQLKDPASTDSYHAIAGSSLVLKLFEKSILLVWGDQIHTDSLQFGF